MDKLHRLDDPLVVGKYLVLVYQTGPWKGHNDSYKTSYAKLHGFRGIKCVRQLRHCFKDHAVCKVITVQ